MDAYWSDIFEIILSCVVALAISLYLAPGIIAAAERYGIVDSPDHPLKQQEKPVAYLGGLVIFIGFVLGSRKEHSVHKADESLAGVGTQCWVTPSGV